MDKKIIFTGNNDQRVLIFIDKITALAEIKETFTMIYTLGGEFLVKHTLNEVIEMIKNVK